MADPLVRHNIWTLQHEDEWHPFILAYARAVAVLRERADSDPTSWVSQAAVHGTKYSDPDTGFHNVCQHGTWHFLPWHRMYLYYFESIIRSVLNNELKNEVDERTKSRWALPYWDYGQGEASRKLPKAFTEPTLRDGTKNWLWHARNPGLTAGNPLPDYRLDIRYVLNLPSFVGAAGFGGPLTAYSHNGDDHGQLEAHPHDVIHGNVGGIINGELGDMGDPNTAALDPIFWLHHANIDRLWEVWLNQGGGRANPSDDRWRRSDPLRPFRFRDADGAEQTKIAADVLDTAVQLNYSYEDISVPGAMEVAPMNPEPDHPSQLVGATTGPVDLGGDTASVSFDVDEPSGPLAADEGPSRVYLRLDDLRSPDQPVGVYGVYVNVPDNDPNTPDDHYAGSFFPFGIGGDHPPMNAVLDITELYQRLNERGQWGPRVDVRFVPRDVEPPSGPLAVDEANEPPGTLHVGQVSVHFQ